MRGDGGVAAGRQGVAGGGPVICGHPAFVFLRATIGYGRDVGRSFNRAVLHNAGGDVIELSEGAAGHAESGRVLAEDERVLLVEPGGHERLFIDSDHGCAERNRFTWWRLETPWAGGQSRG